MKLTVSNVKVGLFIIIGTALATILIVMFGAGVFSRPGLTVETYIDDSVQGLDVGSPLNFRGVRIGRITEIGLVGHFYPEASLEQHRIVVVRMEVRPTRADVTLQNMRDMIETWTKDGMRVRHASQGLTGIGFMEANFVRAEVDQPLEITWTPRAPYIPSTRTQIRRVADSIESIARDLENSNIPKIADTLEDLLVRVDDAVEQANISSISDKVHDSLTRIDKITANVEEITSDPRLREFSTRFSDTLDQLNNTMAELRDNVEQVTNELSDTLEDTRGVVTDLSGHLNDPDIREAIDRMGEVSRQLDVSLARVSTSLARKDEQVDLILLDLRATSNSLRELTQLLSQYPALGAFGEAPPPSEVFSNE
jgi:ABC-type transporter Mla subunit MlaD